MWGVGPGPRLANQPTREWRPPAPQICTNWAIAEAGGAHMGNGDAA